MIAETMTNPFRRDRLNDPDDYVPEWDVRSIAQPVTERLKAAIESARGRTDPDPAGKIHVLLGPPGYGKTHLFGRIAHDVADDVPFLFIPAIEDLNRPLEHIRWHVVENIFRRAGTRPGSLARALCTLCRPSLRAYLDELPATLAARYAPLRDRIDRDPSALLEVAEAVADVAPFLRLADSMTGRFGDLDARLVRALALGWSPAADRARRWLRGETLAPDHASALGLSEDPPEPISVIRAVAGIMAGHAPVVLCLDQLDVLLKARERAPLALSVDLMTILQSVPNLVTVLSCLKVDWLEFFNHCNTAFRDRLERHELVELNEDQVFELMKRRLATSGDRPDGVNALWPFDGASIERYVAKEPPFPRSLLLSCEQAFEDWLDEGPSDQLIELGPSDKVTDREKVFRQLWEDTLGQVRSGPEGNLDHIQDQRLASVLRESFAFLLGAAGHSPAIPVDGDFEIDTVPQAGSLHRYTFEAALDGEPKGSRLVVALEAAHTARMFQYYFDKVDKHIQNAKAFACFVTTKQELPTGPSTRAGVVERCREGVMREVTLKEHLADYQRLECFYTLLTQAERGELLIDGRPIVAPEYRELVEKTRVLDNLGLIGEIFGRWVVPTAERSQTESSTELTSDPVEPEKPALEPVSAKPVAANGQSVAEPARAPATADQAAPGESPTPLAVDDDDDDRVGWAADREDIIIKTLADFNVKVKSTGVAEIGPTFARFLLDPMATQINKIRNRAEDLKIRLGVEALPIIGSQAGAVSVDVQLPGKYRKVVRVDQVGEAPERLGPRAPAWPVGQDVSGKTHWLDFADSNDCHLLVAGTTGSGKSELLKVMIASLARRLGPGNVKFLLVDPKLVTFNFHGEDSPFLLRPVVNDPEEAIEAVKECFEETERRFKLLQERHLTDLEQLQQEDPETAPPRIVVIFDEFADLMADKASKAALEKPLKRLGAKARAAGVHLVLATQRPEASVVTPLLRSNLPSRICLKVATKGDSNIILDSYDGAALLGKGDLLWRRGAGLVRLQSPLVEADELESILFPAMAAAR